MAVDSTYKFCGTRAWSSNILNVSCTNSARYLLFSLSINSYCESYFYKFSFALDLENQQFQPTLRRRHINYKGNSQKHDYQWILIKKYCNITDNNVGMEKALANIANSHTCVPQTLKSHSSFTFIAATIQYNVHHNN